MPNVSLRDLLEAGVHFGHQTRLWNPKMKPYIYGEKNGIHIIDLQRTAKGLLDACRFVSSTVARGGTVLFVGTKRASREIVEEQAARCGMFHVSNRWLGGTLTNFKTVRHSIDNLLELEKFRDTGSLERLTKKEGLDMTRKMEKMTKSMGGIKMMRGLPAVIFVIDPKREHIAIREAARLGIPVVALCDTNCDPDNVLHVIPGNDDAIKSIRLFTTAIADSVMEGNAASRDHLGDNVNAGTRSSGVETYYRRRADAEVEPAAEVVEEDAAEA